MREFRGALVSGHNLLTRAPGETLALKACPHGYWALTVGVCDHSDSNPIPVHVNILTNSTIQMTRRPFQRIQMTHDFAGRCPRTVPARRREPTPPSSLNCTSVSRKAWPQSPSSWMMRMNNIDAGYCHPREILCCPIQGGENT